MITHLLCDLDGTLIDSAPTILAAYQRVLAANGIAPATPLVPELIGPPLVATLRLLTGIDDPLELDGLARQFRHAYDNELLHETRAYPQVGGALAAVRDSRVQVYVVTNKRIAPTRAILGHLGWNGLFEGVYAMDAFDPALASKADVLRRVMQMHEIDPASAAYLGDRPEDADAAFANRLAFVRAAWGYGVPEAFAAFPPHLILDSPAGLPPALTGRAAPSGPAGASAGSA